MNCRSPGPRGLTLGQGGTAQGPACQGWGGLGSGGQVVTVWPCTLAILGSLLATTFS